MKKSLFTVILLLCTLLLNAQSITIAPKLEKGIKKTYLSEMTMSILGMAEVSFKASTDYVVVDALPTGYVLETTLTSFESDAKKDDLMSRIITISLEMTKGLPCRIETDKQGKPLRIQNYADLEKRLDGVIDKLLTEIITEIPDAAAVDKNQLKQQIKSAVNEDKLFKSLTINSSPIALNGKTVSLGLQDEYQTDEGLKMKRTYIPSSDGSLSTNAVLSMTKDDMKQLILNKMKEQGAAQVDESMIDNIINSGMMKFDATEKSVYTFDKSGWVDTLKLDVSSEVMGMKTYSKGIVTLKK